jgi:hypothetical protein
MAADDGAVARNPAHASKAWTVGCLAGIAVWIGVTVAVAARNPDPGDGEVVTRTFAAGGAVFFGVVFAVSFVQMRRMQVRVRSDLYDRLAVEPVDESVVRRSARGLFTIGYAYLGFGVLTTALTLAAIGIADDELSSRLLRITLGLVVVWAAYAVYALRRAWSGTDALMTPLGLRLTATPTYVVGPGGHGRDLVGEVAYAGSRHGRHVTISQRPDGAVTTVTGGDPRRKPPTTALQMATLTGEPVRRWRHVEVTTDAEGTVSVIRRGNGAGSAFLHDLLLAEAIAGSPPRR